MSFYEEYWEGFMAELEKRSDFPLKSKKIRKDNYLSWSCFGRKGFKLIASLRQDSDWICVNFAIDDNSEKGQFADLYERQKDIDRMVGTTLRWVPIGHEKSDTQAILIKRGVDVQDRKDWINQYNWMLDGLDKTFLAFKTHIDDM